MILGQAHKLFTALLLVSITLLAVACMTEDNGDPNEKAPAISPTLKTPGVALASRSYHPNIRIGPKHGKAGTEVTVVGAGFPPGSIVQIRVTGQETGAPKESMAETQAGQHGNIQVSFKMPQKWPSGEIITLPQVTVLASTPDFADKATELFTFDGNTSPGTTP